MSVLRRIIKAVRSDRAINPIWSCYKLRVTLLLFKWKSTNGGYSMLGDLKSWKDLYTEAYLKPC